MTTDRRSWYGTCAACGASLEPGPAYPVSTGTDSGSDVRLHSFCGEDCLARWRDGRVPDGTG